MSPSSNIRARLTKTRGTTYQVRYRPGGRETDWVSVGTFTTMKEARACKQWADGEIAAGRRPNLRAHLAAQEPTTVGRIVADYGRTQTEAAQAKRQRNMVKRLGRLAHMPADEVTGRDIQAWIDRQASGERPLAASSISQYLGQLRRAFAWFEITPNPCDWAHLRIPRLERTDDAHAVDPPELADVQAMIACVTPAAHRRVVILVEGTGMRISEALRLTWGDIDWRRQRIRVPGTKTGAARRWVPLWGDAQAMLQLTPVEDRVATQRIFPRSTDNAVRNAMARACKTAGVRHLHPHDLRDRWISLCGLAGVPLPLIREMAGHRDNTTTLDIYTGLIVAEPAERLAALRDAVAAMSGLSGGTPVGPDASARPTDSVDSRANLRSGGYRDRSDAPVADPAAHRVSPALSRETDAPIKP